MIQGLNITVEIQRTTKGPDDDSGGATNTTATIATGVRARISSIKPTEEIRLQGLETDKLFNMVIFPANTDIRESDLVVPETGAHTGNTFRVTGSQVDSLPGGSSRAHRSIRLERTERARTVF